jgi:hypothetical protein
MRVVMGVMRVQPGMGAMRLSKHEILARTLSPAAAGGPINKKRRPMAPF